jgi:hypothetical protein
VKKKEQENRKRKEKNAAVSSFKPGVYAALSRINPGLNGTICVIFLLSWMD